MSRRGSGNVPYTLGDRLSDGAIEALQGHARNLQEQLRAEHRRRVYVMHSASVAKMLAKQEGQDVGTVPTLSTSTGTGGFSGCDSKSA